MGQIPMIFLDSWIFLEYFLQDQKAAIAVKIIASIENANKGVTSAAAILEVKYRIAKKFGLEKAEDTIVTLEEIHNFSILPVTIDIAKLAANLRVKYYSSAKQLSFIDAINLATAILTSCDKFFTGDKDFIGVNEINAVVI